MIKNVIAFSNNEDAASAFEEVKDTIKRAGSPLLIIFSSVVKDFEFYTKKFALNFKDTQVIGATSSTIFSSCGVTERSISALAVYDGIECFGGVLFEIKKNPMKYAPTVEEAVRKFKNLKNIVCLEFSTSLSFCEELVQDTYRSVLEHRQIQVIGGTAGSEDMYAPTLVSLDGEVFTEASVFVLIKNLGGRIITYKENIFKATGHFFTATDVDCDERIVYQYDYKPAQEALALALNVPVSEIKEELRERPVGRITGKEVYITDTRSFNDDGSITYQARIYNRTRLALLEVSDPEKVWNETAANISYEVPNPSFTLCVNCYGRTLYFKKNGIFDAFVSKLAGEYGNVFGITGHGEQINYEHFNQTMVLAVFE